MRRNGNAVVRLMTLCALWGCNTGREANGGPTPGPADAAGDRSTETSAAGAMGASHSPKPEGDAAVDTSKAVGLDASIDARSDAASESPSDGGVVDSGQPAEAGPAALVEHIVATQ